MRTAAIPNDDELSNEITMHRVSIALLTVILINFVVSVSSPVAAQGIATEDRSTDVRPLGNVLIPDASTTKGKDPFSLLHDRPISENGTLVPKLLASANVMPPQYIYELARRLWATDKPGAMEWLAVGMARARYDSRRCIDKTAQQGITFLAVIAPDVMAGIRENRKAFSEAGRRALRRSDLYVDSVSPLWICSHGMNSIISAIAGKKAIESDWLRSPTEWTSLKNEVSSELDRYFDEQGNLPNEPPLSNSESLSANVSTVAEIVGANFDRTFGQNGVFKMSIEAKDLYVKDSVIQPDGKILVAIALSDKKYVGTTALVRLRPNGTLDGEFGKNGLVSSKIGVNCRPEKVALLPDGKIVVAGWAHVNSEKEGITVTRFNANGSLDLGFADHGTLIFPKGHWFNVDALAIQPDERILIGGSITIRDQRTSGAFVTSVPRDYFFLARIDKNGAFDTDFGDKGLVATEVGGGGKVSGLTIQQDGKIVAAGTGQRGPTSPVIVARYSNTGSLDKNFGGGGLVIRETEKMRYAFPSTSVLSDGKLLVSYFAGKELLLNRVLPDGRVDSAFADGGQRKIATGLLMYGVAPLLLTNDRVFVSGSVIRPPVAGKSQPPYYYDMALAGFLTDGRADSKFGPDGIQVLTVGAVNDRIVSLKLRGKDRIVLIGNSKDQDESQLVLIGLVP